MCVIKAPGFGGEELLFQQQNGVQNVEMFSSNNSRSTVPRLLQPTAIYILL